MNFPSTLLALIALGSLLMPRNAHAQDANVLPIEWKDNPHCARPTTLDADVRRLLGPNTNAPTGTRFLIALSDRNNRDSHNLQLQLRVITHAGPRQRLITVRDCDEAARTAAVLIAVAIDPTVAVPIPNDAGPDDAGRNDAGPNDSGPENGAEEPANDSDSADIAPAAPPQAADTTAWGFGASVGVDVARLPKPSLDVTLRAVARVRRLRLELLASWLPATTKDVPERQHASLDVWAASVAARACLLSDVWGVRVGPCALGRIGMLHGETTGVDRNAPTNTWLLSTGLAGVIECPLSRQLAIDLIWGGEVSLLRPTFSVQGSTASHTLPALSTQVGLGLLAVFE